MSKIDKYLNKLTEEIEKGDRLRCKICGREVTVHKKGKGPLICCGEEMVKLGKVVEAGFTKYPKGWSQKSVTKFARSLADKGGGKAEGFFDQCVKKMQGKIDNPEGFCASVKDEVHKSTYWRGKDKSPAEARKDTKTHKMKKFK